MRARFHALALGFEFAKIGVQAVEEAPYILRLRTEARTRGRDDDRIQPEALRDVDPGRGSGYANLQFISWLQRGFVETDRGVDDSSCVRAINF
ncbi:MAG: hypothetical protein ABSB87_19820 [Terriglobales bacterium]